MAKYIDREKINEIAFTDTVLVKGEVRAERVALLREIDEIPEANVREVVLCKDCKHCATSGNGLWCMLHDDMYAGENYFCADGERKAVTEDDLKALVDELCCLNDENLAQRVTTSNDVQWCLSELSDIIEAVTRGEDCVHWTMGKYPDHGSCEIGKYGRDADDFCSYGERKKYE